MEETPAPSLDLSFPIYKMGVGWSRFVTTQVVFNAIDLFLSPGGWQSRVEVKTVGSGD